MSFRSRLLLAFLGVVVVPLVVFALGVRREMGRRLTAEYERRVSGRIRVIGEDLRAEGADIARRLERLRGALAEDNRFRRAVVAGDSAARPYLLDYARESMQLTGLEMLQVQDATGRILSSGHFRNEYDRLEPELPLLLARAPGGLALVRARRPEGAFVALARSRSFEMGGSRLTLVGGRAMDESFLARLARGDPLTVSLDYPGGWISAEGGSKADDAVAPAAATGDGSDGREHDAGGAAVAAELAIPFIGPNASGRVTMGTARFVVTHPLDELAAIRRGLDAWFVAALAVTVVLALIAAVWLSNRMSRPLAELAETTSRVDLDRLDVRFDSDRRDEIGALTRVLAAMTSRLRASAVRLKEAERRATIGELARQVNHDIKNGLAPIRNALRHLTQVAQREPDRLPEVLEERRATLDAGIGYLEELASNYARLYPRQRRSPCDVNGIIRRVAEDAAAPGAVQLQLDVDDGVPPLLADAVAVRRILENLVANAVESLGSDGGTVSIASEAKEGPGGRVIRVSVADSGRGMTTEEAARAFDDFYSTKETGTGLGLSIVRRLVMDLNGRIRVESEPGRGSRFIVDLPVESASGGLAGYAESEP